MNISNNETDQLLQDYLQGRLQGERLQQIEYLLASNRELSNRLRVLKLIEGSLAQSSLLQPSSNFTQRVMHNLHNIPSSPLLSPKNGLMLLIGVLIATGLAVALVNAGLFNSFNGIVTFENLPLPDGYVPRIPAIPFNGKWVVNVIIVSNLILAFFLLDRTILRPLFDKRSRLQF